jgi:ribosomal protein L32
MNNTLELLEEMRKDLNRIIGDSENPIQLNSLTIPNDSQLLKINQSIGWESESSNWLIVNFRASDNLVNRSYRKWHLNTLNLMNSKCVGNPLLVDHEWFESTSGCGFIIASELRKSNVLPEYQKLGYEEINQKIIAKEGYVELILTAAIPTIEANKGWIDAIKNRVVNSCSTGGEISRARLICPHCSETHGREVLFTEINKLGEYVCPHLAPNSYTMYMDSDDDSYQVADYMELDGDYENLELSLCHIGNLPNAKIIR